VKVISILRCAIAIGEGSSRLGVLLTCSPLFLFDMFFMIGLVQELDVPFMVCTLEWFFCLLGRMSFHFVPCIPPFLGALVYL
jgi:hypothetical protein